MEAELAAGMEEAEEDNDAELEDELANALEEEGMFFLLCRCIACCAM